MEDYFWIPAPCAILVCCPLLFALIYQKSHQPEEWPTSQEWTPALLPNQNDTCQSDWRLDLASTDTLSNLNTAFVGTLGRDSERVNFSVLAFQSFELKSRRGKWILPHINQHLLAQDENLLNGSINCRTIIPQYFSYSQCLLTPTFYKLNLKKNDKTKTIHSQHVGSLRYSMKLQNGKLQTRTNSSYMVLHMYKRLIWESSFHMNGMCFVGFWLILWIFHDN